MRAGTVLRRSGWSEELFLEGDAITIEGIPDRTEPNSCYVATVEFADGTSTDRYTQLSARNTAMADDHLGGACAEQPNAPPPRHAHTQIDVRQSLSVLERGEQSCLGTGS